MAKCGHQLHQPLGRIARFTPRNLLHIAPGQQEKHKHRQRFEIHALPRIIQKRIKAGDKGENQRNGHGRVHAHAAVFQIAPSAFVKRHGRIKHHRQHHQQSAPMQQRQILRLDIVVKISGNGKHHGLHHAKPGHGQPDQRLFALFLRLLLEFLRIIRRGGVARVLHAQQNIGKRHAIIVPSHAHAVGTVVQIHAQHAIKPQQLLLDQPHAGGAGDAAEHQHRFALAAG